MTNLAALRIVKNFRSDAISKLPSIRTPKARNGVPPPKVRANPFLPTKTSSGKWRAPVYSLRKQSEIIKAAKSIGMAHLIPHGPAHPIFHCPNPAERKAEEARATDELMAELKEQGEKNLQWIKPVKWIGSVPKSRSKDKNPVSLYAVDKRMFKGHKWERTSRDRGRRRYKLMLSMKKRVYNYKMFYRRRRPDPLKLPRTVKSPKLPF